MYTCERELNMGFESFESWMQVTSRTINRGGQGTSTRLYPGACINFPGLVIQTQIIDGAHRDADAGHRHGPYSCPGQLLEAERLVCDANSAPNRMSNGR